MQTVKLGKSESWLAEAGAIMPWGHSIDPEDVARLALFLLSDVSIPMTGALIDQEQYSVLRGPQLGRCPVLSAPSRQPESSG